MGSVLRNGFRVAASVMLFVVFSPSLVSSETVQLRTSCAGWTLGVDCWEDSSALSTWLWTNRSPLPSATDPVTVIVEDTGGTPFIGHISCSNSGYVTFRGESRTGSVLQGLFGLSGFASFDCDDLTFHNLTIRSNQSISSAIGVLWSGSGDSLWVDVDIDAIYTAWYDSWCTKDNSLPPTGTHYFQNSTLTAGAIGWFADCGVGVLYDSAIAVEPDDSTFIPNLGPGPTVIGAKGSHRGEVYLNDSTVSVDASSKSSPVTVLGLDAGEGGNSHPKGSGSVEMLGGALTLAGDSDDTLISIQADTFGQVTGEDAYVELLGAAATIRGQEGVTKAGDGDIVVLID